MTTRGQDLAIESLSQLEPDSSTNLWGGLETALNIFKSNNAHESRREAATLVFTDGVPNIFPPRGHLASLKIFKEKCGGNLPCTIHTFGFGYSLESDMLNELAVEGRGSYSFIPDAGFVGTIFG